MRNLIEALNNLENVLDKNEKILKIKELNREIERDKDLINMIKEYNLYRNDMIKNKIINNPLFKEYKKYETDINVIILEINQKLKEINNRGKCSL